MYMNAPGWALKIDGSLTGIVHVSQDVGVQAWFGIMGNVSGNGNVVVHGLLDGKIRVNGSLLNTVSGPEIEIGGAMASSAAIAINSDGYEVGDDNWALGAVIRVNGTDYTGNTPASRIVDITCPKGDMDNSADPRNPSTWHPDFDDINPFVLALSNPSAYDTAYVALSESRVYHADCNCDGVVDFDDIDAFTARLGGVIPACETCNWGDAPAGPPAPLDPVAVAEMYRTRLAPERLPVFVQMVRALVSRYDGAPRGEFWAAVLANLG
jgi:hypothetical protein